MEKMDWITFLQIVCVPAFGWTFHQCNKLKGELHQFKFDVAKEYVTKADIQRLEAKIDGLRDLIIEEMKK